MQTSLTISDRSPLSTIAVFSQECAGLHPLQVSGDHLNTFVLHYSN